MIASERPPGRATARGASAKRVVLAACLSGALGVTRRADAQATATDRLLAQSLFDQAKKLMEAGRYDQACPKLAESERLDPAGGTLLNLALCHEKEGRLATAWADFKEALGVARRAGRVDRERAALTHIAALEPRLARLTLEVPATVEGLIVKLDGQVVGSAAWNTPTPIDPGRHDVITEAPGRRPWSEHVEIEAGRQTTLLLVPPPASEPRVHAETEPAASIHEGEHLASANKWLRPVASAVGAAGVVAIGLGSYFGVQAISNRRASDSRCPMGDDQCSSEGVQYNNEAKTDARRSDIAIGAGLVGVGVATYLFLRSSRSTPADTTAHASHLGPVVARDAAGLDVRGSW